MTSVTTRSKSSSDEANASVITNATLEIMFTRVIGELTKSFEAGIARIVQAIDQKLSLRLDVQVRNIHDLNVRLDKAEQYIADIRAENVALRTELKTLYGKQDKQQADLDELEQYTRSDNIIIHD